VIKATWEGPDLLHPERTVVAYVVDHPEDGLRLEVTTVDRDGNDVEASGWALPVDAVRVLLDNMDDEQ
jgi:hypothetical protein